MPTREWTDKLNFALRYYFNLEKLNENKGTRYNIRMIVSTCAVVKALRAHVDKRVDLTELLDACDLIIKELNARWSRKRDCYLTPVESMVLAHLGDVLVDVTHKSNDVQFATLMKRHY